MIPALRALPAHGTVGAMGGIRDIFPIAQPVGRSVGQNLAGRTAIAVLHCVIEVVPLVEVAIAVIRPFVAHDPEQCPVEDALADLWREIPGIKSDGAHGQVKAFLDPIQTG